MPASGAAVVVATHRRPALLPRLVRALEAQRDVGSFDVVIVDDCSGDETSEVLEALAATTTLALRVLTQPDNRGPAAARNRGWRSTSAEVVAFTDDDCVPQPRWLATLLDGAAGADIVQGRTAPNPGQSEHAGPFSRTLDVRRMDGFFQTCNIAYRRRWLERLGGFDEDFRFPMAEDTDLAWRGLRDGAIAAFAEEALVHHDVRPSSAWTTILDSRRWESVALIVKKHPEIRTKLHSRYFWKAAHAPALAAAVGMVAAALVSGAYRRAALLALTAPYVKHRLVDAPLPHVRRRDRLHTLPAAFAVDVSETAVLVAASVRYGTLVL